MVHKPKHKVHSFRGLLADGGEDEINLERQNVNLAYRIVKFVVFPNFPGTQDYESTLQVWRESQDSISTTTATVDFTDADLLAVGYFVEDKSATYGNPPGVIAVFDNILFSRNIYVTHTSTISSSVDESMNYYLELEEVPVGAATLMQLKLGVARKLNLKQDPVPT